MFILYFYLKQLLTFYTFWVWFYRGNVLKIQCLCFILFKWPETDISGTCSLILHFVFFSICCDIHHFCVYDFFFSQSCQLVGPVTTFTVHTDFSVTPLTRYMNPTHLFEPKINDIPPFTAFLFFSFAFTSTDV